MQTVDFPPTSSPWPGAEPGPARPAWLPADPTARGQLRIQHTWDGQPIGHDAQVGIELAFVGGVLEITVNAPFFDDPAPGPPPGSTPALWNHEVVEVFFLGADERYLEVELGPHGHHLVLALEGVRQVVRQGFALDFVAARSGQRWQGRARVPCAWLPPGWDRLNAHAIHGTGEARRHLSWQPARGERPDFHVLPAFVHARLAFGATPPAP